MITVLRPSTTIQCTNPLLLANQSRIVKRVQHVSRLLASSTATKWEKPEKVKVVTWDTHFAPFRPTNFRRIFSETVWDQVHTAKTRIHRAKDRSAQQLTDIFLQSAPAMSQLAWLCHSRSNKPRHVIAIPRPIRRCGPKAVGCSRHVVKMTANASTTGTRKLGA